MPTGQLFYGMSFKANSLYNIPNYTDTNAISFFPKTSGGALDWQIPNLQKLGRDYTRYNVLGSKVTIKAWANGTAIAPFYIFVFPTLKWTRWMPSTANPTVAITGYDIHWFMAQPFAKWRLIKPTITNQNYVRVSNYVTSRKMLVDNDVIDDEHQEGQILPYSTVTGASSGPSANWYWNIVIFKADGGSMGNTNPVNSTITVRPYCVLAGVRPDYQGSDELIAGPNPTDDV